MNEPSYIVFLCFGDEGFYYECAFALLSLSRLYKPGEFPFKEICIYTDKPEWFQRFKGCTLPLNFRKLTGEEIEKWRGGINYLYRTKIEVLKDFAGTHSGNILYLDTDIVITHLFDAMLENIGKDQVYMHSLDGVVNTRATPMLAKLDTHLRKSKKQAANAQNLYDLAMWNSGVIGYNTNRSNFAESVLALIDNIYPKGHSIRVIEQFAVAVKFQESQQIYPALPYALHYWNLKEMRIILASFFNHFKDRDWDELVQLSGMIQVFELMVEKVRFENNRSTIARLVNKQWNPPVMNWEQLKAQL